MPFLITSIAGLSTLIGFLFIYFKNTENRVLIISLGFASGVMFFISIFDLIPEGYSLLNEKFYTIFSILVCLIFIVIGIIIAGFIDKLSEKGDDLYHVGIVSMIAIILHNIPEGIATYLTSTVNIKLGITLAIAITLHNIPEGISISVPIYYSTNSKSKAFFYTLISGISELLGAVIAFVFLKGFNLSILYLIIAGIMLYISIYELLPASLKYKNYFKTFCSFIIGIIFIYISIILLQ